MRKPGATVVAIIVCCACTAAAGNQRPRDDYAQVAEGLSSSRAGATIDVAFRMFSLPGFGMVCDRARAADAVRLRSDTPRIRLRVGERLVLRTLKIVALDAGGHILPDVPLAVEAETAPALFDLRSDHIADSELTAVKAGRAQLRARTLCPQGSGETLIPVQVQS